MWLVGQAWLSEVPLLQDVARGIDYSVECALVHWCCAGQPSSGRWPPLPPTQAGSRWTCSCCHAWSRWGVCVCVCVCVCVRLCANHASVAHPFVVLLLLAHHHPRVLTVPKPAQVQNAPCSVRPTQPAPAGASLYHGLSLEACRQRPAVQPHILPPLPPTGSDGP